MSNTSHTGPRWLRKLGQLNNIGNARRESGQIIVLFAVFVVILMVLAGSAYDYASIVVDDAQLQNAVDAAVLAGSNTLAQNASKPTGTPATIAQATAVAYLAQNGVATQTPGTTVNITFPTSTPVGSATPSPLVENMSINVTRNHSTAFWPLIGVPSVSMRGNGGAHAARSMLDVFISLDTTGSLVNSQNLTDNVRGLTYTTVQDAVVAFINAMGPTTTDPRGPKIGIGRYAGIKCQFVGSDPNNLYLYSTGPGDYAGTCTDDMTILTSPTFANDPAALLQIASGPSSGCPADANYACPIQHRPFMLNGTYSPSLWIDGSNYNWTLPLIGGIRAGAPYYTGTKEPNALCVVNPADSLCPHTPAAVSTNGFAWKGANGARNCQSDGLSWPCPTGTSQNQGRRVLIIMTDGQDESWPTTTTGNPVSSNDYGMPEPGIAQPLVATYNTNFNNLATNLKATQPDGSPGVEIYVVGFFCTSGSYNPSSYPPNNFCQSRIAYQTVPRSCPGTGPYIMNPGAGATGSPTDDLLVQVSSSASGTCDHYFPISKTASSDSLSVLFADMAGTISRGQLTQ
jgi:Flp pilus assembly protein TadG